MTEDEAKLRWCPMVRYYNGDDGANSTNRSPEVWSKENHGATSRTNAHCIGSQCMAWRTSHTSVTAGGTIVTEAEPGHGWCGLAGRP